MKQVRIIVEYSDGSESPTMRWERIADDANAGASTATFELLGRAFEVAQREEGAAFGESLAAFFKGAMLGRQDIMEVLSRLD